MHNVWDENFGATEGLKGKRAEVLGERYHEWIWRGGWGGGMNAGRRLKSRGGGVLRVRKRVGKGTNGAQTP